MADIGITYFGDIDAVYNLDREAQVRLLAWHRVKIEPQKQTRRFPPVAQRDAQPQPQARPQEQAWDFFGGAT